MMWALVAEVLRPMGWATYHGREEEQRPLEWTTVVAAAMRPLEWTACHCGIEELRPMEVGRTPLLLEDKPELEHFYIGDETCPFVEAELEWHLQEEERAHVASEAEAEVQQEQTERARDIARSVNTFLEAFEEESRGISDEAARRKAEDTTREAAGAKSGSRRRRPAGETAREAAETKSGSRLTLA